MAPPVADVLTTYAQLQPDKAAVIHDPPDGPLRSVSYAELEAAANRLVHVLADHGARPGETKVVWCGPNSVGVATMMHAARKLGVTAVPLNYRLSDEEAAYVTDHCDATIVYVDAEYAPMFARIRASIPKVEHVVVYGGSAPAGMVDGDACCAAARDGVLALDVPDSVPATMIYTSGTTGKPKGALRRGSGDPAQLGALLALIGYTPDDVYLTTGPLYHSGPAAFMSVAFALGQTTVVQRKFDPEDWLRLVDTHRVTSTFSAPTPIRMITRLAGEVKARYDVSSMRRMIANAAPWSMALKHAYLADFPAESLYEVYGSTELGINCVLEPSDQLRKPGSCGRPAPMVEVKLFDVDGNEVVGTGPEHTGELYVKSASVFNDYYKQHDKFLADHRHGYQTVGDIAYLDDDGYVYICDRKKDMIITGGMNVYPAEIEAALEHHPDIYEAAVFGIPDEDWGEIVHAVVVARPGAELSEDAVVAYAKEHLANYKVPRSIGWLDELPKTGSGKILKRELRAPFWAGRSSQV